MASAKGGGNDAVVLANSCSAPSKGFGKLEAMIMGARGKQWQRGLCQLGR